MTIPADLPVFAFAGDRLIARGPADPIWLKGDPHRLRQIVNNLMSNAVKFTPRGKVVLDVSGAERARMDVTDLLQMFEKTRGEQVSDDALLLLQEHAYSLVITDMRLPDGTGLDLIRKLEADRKDYHA